MAYIVPNPYVKKSMLLCYIRHYIACVTENEFQLATIFNRCSRKEPTNFQKLFRPAFLFVAVGFVVVSGVAS